jgi:hypothetical protein
MRSSNKRLAIGWCGGLNPNRMAISAREGGGCFVLCFDMFLHFLIHVFESMDRGSRAVLLSRQTHEQCHTSMQ